MIGNHCNKKYSLYRIDKNTHFSFRLINKQEMKYDYLGSWHGTHIDQDIENKFKTRGKNNQLAQTITYETDIIKITAPFEGQIVDKMYHFYPISAS